MRGKISDFGIPEIFQLVATQGKSGALTIRGDERKTVFLFTDGKIVDVLPDRRLARSGLLGNMLVDAGYLTEEELRRLLAQQGQEGKKLGEILVEKGKISRENLSRYLYLQVKESLYHALMIKDGEYHFEAFAVRPPSWMSSPMRADILMMEGVQFLDEYPRIREKLPAGRFVVFAKKGVKIDPGALPPEERTVWQAVEYSSDPSRIFRKACVTWFEGVKAIHALLDRGLVDVVPESVEREDPWRGLRKELRHRSRLATVRAVLWGLAAMLVGVWAYTVLLSPRGIRAFAGWTGFF
ncbi:MAG: hypothetical protein Kow00128_12620 [Deltaproteobacteria bacterium]